MKDDERRILWSLATELREPIFQHIALHIPRPVGGSDSESDPQVSKPLRLLGPDERF